MKVLKYLFNKLFRLERYKDRYLFIEEASIGLLEDDEILLKS
ncbi:hypothetical protein [Terrisporobacter sp.]